jgi:hypothetical protein
MLYGSFLLASPGRLFRNRIRPQSPAGLSCPPDLLVVNVFQVVLKIFAVGLAAVKFKRLPGLGTILYRLEQRLVFSTQSSAAQRVVVEQA